MILSRNTANKNKRFGLGKRKFIYSKKTYTNPFFRRKRTAIARPGDLSANKIKLTLIALVVAIAILIWLLFFSALFKIIKIEVGGVGEGTVKEIETAAWSQAGNRLWGRNNLLLFDKSELGQALNEKYYLQSLSIKKVLFHTLKISLREKQPAAVWQEDDKFYYIDNQGKVINQVDPLSVNRKSRPLVENLSGLKMDGRQANINQSAVDYILALFNEFKDKKHDFEIEKFILDKDINTVKMAIMDGPKIYFNTDKTLAEQAAALDLLIREKLKDSFKNKEYINLKYGNNIYIKWAYLIGDKLFFI